jgi:sterol desaturase/sphingolipid hydroxylase (fatty acid hydroxylase superfamily)
VLFNLEIVILAISGKDTKSINYLYTEITPISDKIVDFIGRNLLTPNILTMLVWMVIGIIVYSLINFSSEKVGEVAEKINISKSYVHPKNFKNRDFWFLNITEFGLSALMLFALIAWSVVSIKVLLPFAALQFLFAVYDSSSILNSVAQTIFSLIIYMSVVFGYLFITKSIHYFKHRIS